MSQKEPIGILSHGNIGRTRRVGSDEDGLPIEETIPSLEGLVMYDRDGNRLHVPTSCHRAKVKGQHQEMYKAQIIKDLLTEGYLREDRCPHVAVEALGDKPPVDPPKGFATCKGPEPFDKETGLGGCEHLRPIVERRRQLARNRAKMRKNEAAKAATLLLGQKIAKEAVKVAETSDGTSVLQGARAARRESTAKPGQE